MTSKKKVEVTYSSVHRSDSQEETKPVGPPVIPEAATEWELQNGSIIKASSGLPDAEKLRGREEKPVAPRLDRLCEVCGNLTLLAICPVDGNAMC